MTADLYSQQLTRVSEALERKRLFMGKGKRKITLLHDNARPHVAKTTQSTIVKLGWEVLSHSAYSPDLAPSDYHLFRSMEHFFREKTFTEVSKRCTKRCGSVFRSQASKLLSERHPTST